MYMHEHIYIFSSWAARIRIGRGTSARLVPGAASWPAHGREPWLSKKQQQAVVVVEAEICL